MLKLRCITLGAHRAFTHCRLPTGPTNAFAVAAAGRHSLTKAAAKRSAVSDDEDPDSSVDQKAAAFNSVMKSINSKYGKGTIMTFTEKPMHVEYIPTGALTLDVALGGGYPKGRIVEIYGPESSGKSTLALHAMVEVHKRGGNVVLVDAEHAFDQIYAEKLGLDTSERVALQQPDSGEQALDVVDQLIRSGSCELIVVDSVAALVPMAELEGEVGAPTMGSQARLMGQGLRKISANAAKMGCTVIFLNQLRQKIGVLFGNPEVTPGGNALKYYASVRIDLRRMKTMEKDGSPFGIRVKAKVVKNKCAPPSRVAEFDIEFDKGVNSLGCVVDAALKLGVLQQKGAWIYLDGTKIAQGREKALAYLTENEATLMQVKNKVLESVQGGGGFAQEEADVDEDPAFAEVDAVPTEEST